MPFKLVEFEILQLSIQESVASLLRDHHLDLKDPNLSIKGLPDRRRIQACFLQITAYLLKESKTEALDKKTLILNAAVYYIRQRIVKSYKPESKSITQHILYNPVTTLSPERSSLYRSLTTSLNINTKNIPNKREVLEFYRALKEFLCAHLYIDSSVSKGYLAYQPYTIQGHSIECDILKLDKEIIKLYAELVKETQQHRQIRMPRPKNAGPGLFNGSYEEVLPEAPAKEQAPLEAGLS